MIANKLYTVVSIVAGFLFSIFKKYDHGDNINIVIVTGSDWRYYDTLLVLLESIAKNVKTKHKTVVYDLGMTSSQLERLKCIDNITIKTFEYSKYPSYVDIKSEMNGSYAWKPIIIWSEYNECDADVLMWLDASCYIDRGMGMLAKIIKVLQIFTPQNNTRIGDRTHRKTIEYFGVDKSLKSRRSATGGIIGFVTRNSAVHNIVEQWMMCSLCPDVICPAGATIDNHRYDQSILSILMYRNGYIPFRYGSLNIKVRRS